MASNRVLSYYFFYRIKNFSTIFNVCEVFYNNQYRTVAEKYPETGMRRYVVGHCDNLRDYIPKREKRHCSHHGVNAKRLWRRYAKVPSAKGELFSSSLGELNGNVS